MGEVDGGDGLAQINLLRRALPRRLQKDQVAMQDTKCNGPESKFLDEKPEIILNEFPNARALLIGAKIIRTIEDIHVLKPDVSLSYSYKTKTWSRDTARDIRGIAWSCDGLLTQYFNDGSASVRQFLRNLEDELLTSVAPQGTIILRIPSPDHVGVKLIVREEQWCSIKRGYWVILDDRYDIPQIGAFQYIFNFNGSDAGKLQVVRVLLEATVSENYEIVFDGNWDDVALDFCS